MSDNDVLVLDDDSDVYVSFSKDNTDPIEVGYQFHIMNMGEDSYVLTPNDWDRILEYNTKKENE